MLYDSDYIGEYDPTIPYISPMFGSYDKLPALLYQVGSFDMLRSDSEVAHEKAIAAGCDSRLSVYEGMFHEFQMSLNLIPESKQAWKEVAAFIKERFELESWNHSRKLRKG